MPSRMGAAVAAAARAFLVAWEDFGLIWEMIMERGNRKNRETE